MSAVFPFARADRIPTTIVTGFLGSGKTTLINRLLRMPGASDAAVIVNEFGEIGIDNELIEKVDGNVTLLESGCVCCTVQDELSMTMHDLIVRRERGEIPRFARMVIETTGLADPGPISHRLLAEPRVASYYTLAAVVTTVDSVNGLATLKRHREAIRQAALADRLLLTKTDISDERHVAELVTALARLNPRTAPVRAADEQIDAQTIAGSLTDPASDAGNLAEWLGREQEHADTADGGGHDHGSGVHTFSVIREQALSWGQVSRWLELLGAESGEGLLRVKGIVNVEGQAGPAVIHGVQRIIHLPTVLREWPGDDRRTRVVFITQGLDRERIEGLLDAACARA